MNKKKFTVRDMAMIGVMAAIVFVGNNIQLPKIPTPLGPTRIHIGNVMCILAGFLFGAVPGGLAAGFGGAIYDLMDPFYAKEFWITFILKFVMGWGAGFIANKGVKTKIKVVIAAVVRQPLADCCRCACYKRHSKYNQRIACNGNFCNSLLHD